nr:single-stranded-DNA-specific exonuclease RecJ [Phenylobacterium sp.]
MADGATPAGYLGVTRSLSGRLWRERAADPETVRRHEMALGLAEPLARALASRGVEDGQGEHYLNPTLKALFPDPSSFMDMDKAAQILVDAVTKGRPMAVFADYDVD